MRQIFNNIQKKICLSLMLFVCGSLLQAQNNVLKIESDTVSRDTDISLSVSLENESEISGGQFSVSVPDGFVIKTITLSDERKNGHTLDYRLNSNSTSAMVMFYSQPTATIKGNSGSIVDLIITVPKELSAGDYPILLSEVKLAVNATSEAKSSFENGYLTIEEMFDVKVETSVGGTVTGGGSYEMNSVAEIVAIPDEGYHFEEWSDGSKDNPYRFQVTESTVIRASFLPNEYKLEFIIDGEVYQTASVAYGSTLVLPEVSEREGYTFSGWSGAPETMPAKDVTVTGSFAVNYYTVKYYLDGEFFSTEEVAYGSAIPTPEIPSKEGYNFDGWQDIPAAMPAEDVVLHGTYSINKDMKYNVIYMVDGVEYKRVSVSYQDPIVLIAEPEKEGYTFSGWSEVPELMPLKDVTVIGTLTVNEYQVTYILDGEVYQTASVAYGSSLVLPEVAEREGYTFSGWSGVPETMPAKDVTVTGSFSTNSYTITYLLDGEEYYTELVEYGKSITMLAEPTKEGYTFSGWSEVPATMPANDITITGSFSVNYYTVEYYLDGELFSSEKVAFGSVIPTPEVPSKEGYNFDGWQNVPSTMPAEAIVINGSYSINKDMKYNVIYMVDGVEYKRESVSYQDPIVLIAEPEKEGYTFSGWSEVPELMPLKDVTVIGTFAVNEYQVIYVLDGEVYQTVTVAYGSTLVLPEVSEREGYTFSGWSGVPETMPAEDIVIDGTYIANMYQLIYIVDGETYEIQNISYGETIIPIAAPTKEGYIFSGWSAIPETMPAEVVVVIGSFVVDNVSIPITESVVNVYSIDGKLLLNNVHLEDAKKNLHRGIYIINGSKILIE